MAQPLAVRDSRVLGMKCKSYVLAILGVKCVAFGYSIAVFEREHLLSKQKRADRMAECKDCLWCTQFYFQLLFADSELDVFIDDYRSAFLARVIANPLQTEYTQCQSEL